MVHGAVRDRVLANYEDAGDHNFKNIARAVRVFRIVSNTEPDNVPTGRTNGQTAKTSRRWFAMGMVFLVITAIGLVVWLRSWKPDIEPADLAKLALALPDRPSIAVLPFENFSEDKTEGYFADGVTDDIITDLPNVSGLFVVARNATFAYKDKPVKLRQVSEDLGYVFYAANLAMLGRTDDAARQAEMVLKLNPDFNLSGWRWINTYKSPTDRRHLYDAAKRAGVPEYPQAEKPTSPPGNQG